MPTSIQDDLQSLFSDFANKTLTQPAEGIAPTLLIPTTPPEVVPPVVADITTIEPTTQVVTPKVEVKVEPDAVVENWDGSTSTTSATTNEPNAPVPSPVSVDYSKVANALGKEKIASEDELVTEVKSVKQELETYKTLPENLSKAVELAKLGGNYLEYLGVSQIDWRKEDPITLYENYVEGQFTSSDGAVDFDRVDKILDKLDDDEKELRGRELQARYVNFQNQQKAQLEAQARAERAAFENTLRSTVNQLNEVGNFKLSQNHKEELFSDILTGKDLQFSNLQQRAISYFIRKNWNKIDEFRRQQIKNAAAREILEEAQLPVIRPSTEAAPVPTNKNYSLDDFLKEIEFKKNSRF